MRILLTGAMARALAVWALIAFDLAFATPGATAQVQIPALPPPAPAMVDAKTRAYLVLDFGTAANGAVR
jgi:membrane-bound lytic murein transglycosylase